MRVADVGREEFQEAARGTVAGDGDQGRHDVCAIGSDLPSSLSDLTPTGHP
jgi:hypothetical protein